MATLSDFFKVSIFASGTPAAFQNLVGNQFPQNVCSCSPKTAIENGWIKAPTLNLIKGYKNQWPQAVLTVLHNEIANYSKDGFPTRILANFTGIDDIHEFVNLPGIQNRIGDEFHLITIHSQKKYEKDNVVELADCWKDFEKINAAEAYKEIGKIDENNCFDDDLPIIVCQVDMIGEGINVKSFNAVLTSSNSDKKVMQQVGRGMREYPYNGKTKVKDGHCNLYVLHENVEEVFKLLKNLEEYELTEDCFTWGKRTDISTGSTTGKEDDTPNELNKQKWEAIDPLHDLDIQVIRNNLDAKQSKYAAKEFVIFNFDYKPNDVESLIKHLKDVGLTDFYPWFNNPTQMLYNQMLNVKKGLDNNAILKKAWNCGAKSAVLKRIVEDDYFAKWIASHMTKKLEIDLNK